jgi:hypothetical protein
LRQLILQGHFLHWLDAHIQNKPTQFRTLTPDIPAIAAYTSVQTSGLSDQRNHISELPFCCNAIDEVVLQIEPVSNLSNSESVFGNRKSLSLTLKVSQFLKDLFPLRIQSF